MRWVVSVVDHVTLFLTFMCLPFSISWIVDLMFHRSDRSQVTRMTLSTLTKSPVGLSLGFSNFLSRGQQFWSNKWDIPTVPWKKNLVKIASECWHCWLNCSWIVVVVGEELSSAVCRIIFFFLGGGHVLRFLLTSGVRENLNGRAVLLCLLSVVARTVMYSLKLTPCFLTKSSGTAIIFDRPAFFLLTFLLDRMEKVRSRHEHGKRFLPLKREPLCLLSMRVTLSTK